MSKLLKLKKWLPIDEALSYLSDILEEEIFFKDLYQLILDEQITLSIKFTKPHTAQLGQLIDFAKNSDKDQYRNPDLFIDKSRKVCLQFKDEIENLEGIWDLQMYGGAKVTLEERYNFMITGKSNPFPKLCDLIIKRNDIYARLLMDQEYNPGATGSVAYCINQKKKLKEAGATEIELEQLEIKLEEFRSNFIAYRKDASVHFRYYNLAYIPSDVIEVIKVEQILKLLTKVNSFSENQKDEQSNFPVNTKEKHSYLVLISALLERNNIFPNERGAAGRISRIAEKQGTPISEDTVRKIIKEIPEALMAREK